MKFKFFLINFLILNSCYSFSQDKIFVENLRNWLFVNVNNPMFIDFQNIPLTEITIKAHSCKISNIDAKGYFQIKPLHRGNIYLKVFRVIKKDSTLIWEGQFFSKNLPKPVAFINFRKNEMSKSEFLCQRGLKAELINYDFNIQFPIESYTLVITKDDKLLLLKEYEGGNFSKEMINKLDQLLKKGERLFFTNIKIKSPYHYNKIINSIEIKIK